MYKIGPISLTGFSSKPALTALSLSIFLLPGCSIMTATGPSTSAVKRAGQEGSLDGAGIRMVDVTDGLARQMIAWNKASLFSEVFPDSLERPAVIGKGDLLDIVIWEAPPATLFGVSESELGPGRGSVARQTGIPSQVVDANGCVSVPFIGSIQADGRTTAQLSGEIAHRLTGKAHMPQVIVRIADNATSTVTIVGEVQRNLRMPLTSKRERLLDALAAAGGAKQQVGKITVQISRNGVVQTMPLDTVIKDPQQNVMLQSGDVVTALYQPFSFIALGAIGKNEEIEFEGTGLTLAQALGRIGGLSDARADAKGVFIFRLEDKAALGLTNDPDVRTTPDGKVPVIYRFNLRDPATFFIAQSFPIRSKDVLYVSNAPLADIQKFVSIVASFVYPIVSVENVTR